MDKRHHLIEHLQDQGKLPTLPAWRGIKPGQVLVSGVGLLAMGTADVAMHFDKTGVFLGLLVAGGVIKHSDDILHLLVPGSDAKQVVERTARVVDQVAPVSTCTYVDQSAQAKLKRLFGFRSSTHPGLYLQAAPVVPPPQESKERAAGSVGSSQTRKGVLTWGTSVQFNRRFDPPVNSVLGKGLLITGAPGAGKSNLIGHTLTSAAGHDIPCLLVDYKHEFYPLRDLLQTCMLIGHPDFAERVGAPYYPLTLGNVEECAADLIGNCYQGVFCVPSYDDPDEMAEILAKLLHALVDYQVAIENEDDRLPFLCFTDEAHNFVPEKDSLSALPLEAKNFKRLKKAYVKMATLGRSYGCTLIHATQRLANIGKPAVGTLQIQILMKQDLDIDIDRCEEYIGKGHRDELRNLPAGRAFVKGLSKNPMLVQFDQQKARHVSKTPDLSRIQKKIKRDPRLPVSRVLAKRIPGTNQYEKPAPVPSTSNIRTLRPALERLDDENDRRYGRPVTGSVQHQFELEPDGNATLRYGRNVDGEVASQEDGRAQNDDVSLPTGWDQKKLEMLPGFYAVFNHLDNTLKALQLSASQRNRDFAREVLRQQGLWKEAK